MAVLQPLEFQYVVKGLISGQMSDATWAKYKLAITFNVVSTD